MKLDELKDSQGEYWHNDAIDAISFKSKEELRLNNDITLNWFVSLLDDADRTIYERLSEEERHEMYMRYLKDRFGYDSRDVYEFYASINKLFSIRKDIPSIVYMLAMDVNTPETPPSMLQQIILDCYPEEFQKYVSMTYDIDTQEEADYLLEELDRFKSSFNLMDKVIVTIKEKLKA